MEGPLSAVAWLMIAGAAATGSCMYFGLRPYDGPTHKRAGMFFVATAFGTVVTPGICEANSWASVYLHLLVAVTASLLCTPVCSAAVKVAESEAVGWIKKAVLRVLGVRDSPQDEGKQ